MEIQNPKEKFDFDCSVLMVANRIIRNGATETPEQQLDNLKTQFAATGQWAGTNG